MLFIFEQADYDDYDLEVIIAQKDIPVYAKWQINTVKHGLAIMFTFYFKHCFNKCCLSKGGTFLILPIPVLTLPIFLLPKLLTSSYHEPKKPNVNSIKIQPNSFPTKYIPPVKNKNREKVIRIFLQSN